MQISRAGTKAACLSGIDPVPGIKSSPVQQASNGASLGHSVKQYQVLRSILSGLGEKISASWFVIRFVIRPSSEQLAREWFDDFWN